MSQVISDKDPFDQAIDFLQLRLTAWFVWGKRTQRNIYTVNMATFYARLAVQSKRAGDILTATSLLGLAENFYSTLT